jgi:hypothetical protein
MALSSLFRGYQCFRKAPRSKTEVGVSSEMLVTIHEATLCHTSADHSLNFGLHENCKPHTLPSCLLYGLKDTQ